LNVTTTTCNTLQQPATHCNMMQHTHGHLCVTKAAFAIDKVGSLRHCNTPATYPQHTRNILQHAAACCNTLQYDATHSPALECCGSPYSALQCAEVCCSVLQCVAVFCNVAEALVATKPVGPPHCYNLLQRTPQYTATRCNTLQHATTRCNTLIGT